MKDCQEALNYLTSLERLDVMEKTGDVVPHPASDLLQTFLNTLKIIGTNLKEVEKDLEYIGSMEVCPEENIYVSDYDEFYKIKKFLDVLSQILEVE